MAAVKTRLTQLLQTMRLCRNLGKMPSPKLAAEKRNRFVAMKNVKDHYDFYQSQEQGRTRMQERALSALRLNRKRFFDSIQGTGRRVSLRLSSVFGLSRRDRRKSYVIPYREV